MPKKEDSNGEGQNVTANTYQEHDGGTPNGTLVTGLYGLQGLKARLSLAPRMYCESSASAAGCLARNNICKPLSWRESAANRFIMRGLPPQGCPAVTSGMTFSLQKARWNF